MDRKKTHEKIIDILDRIKEKRDLHDPDSQEYMAGDFAYKLACDLLAVNEQCAIIEVDYEASE